MSTSFRTLRGSYTLAGFFILYVASSHRSVSKGGEGREGRGGRERGGREGREGGRGGREEVLLFFLFRYFSFWSSDIFNSYCSEV